MAARLTGKRRYRVDEHGKVILQVQERYYFNGGHGHLPVSNKVPTWRDATVEDLTEHEFHG